jgi:predicted metal-dependent phosphotriesterase family hydrolase
VTSGHVQTVRGPVDPAEVGWVLPHEHTAIALWHIPDRWDYWELRRDEAVIVEELARFVAVGGSAIVDLTLPGVGRDPGWLVGLAETTGLHVVMGSGWYRDAYYPVEALIDRRRGCRAARSGSTGPPPGPPAGRVSRSRPTPSSRPSASTS